MNMSDHRVSILEINRKPETILGNKESYNYNKTDLSTMNILMRRVN